MKLDEAKDYFKQIQDEENKNRARWLDDLRFGMSDDQWPENLRRSRENDRDGPRPCLTVNKIPSHARQIINDMRQNRAGIKVLPVDDKADVATAEILQGMIRHIEHSSEASMAYDIASEYQVFMGMGYFRVIPEIVDPLFNYQDLRIRSIRNPFSVYFDPWAQDLAGSDATRAFVTEILAEDAYKKEYPDAEVVNWESEGEGDGWIMKDSVRVAEHYWLADRDVDYVKINGDFMRADDFKRRQIDVVVEEERTIKEPGLNYQKISGAEILEEKELPGRYIPIIRCVGEDFYLDDERHICGIVRRARDAQRLYNYAVSSNAERNALQPKAPWLIAAEGADGYEDDYQQANQGNIPYLSYNAYDDEGRPIPPPQRQFPTGVDAGTVNMIGLSDDDIQATIGQFAASLGDSSNEKSGKAILARQRVGDIATYHYPDNMARAIRHAGRVIVDLIPYYYDTQRVARTLGEDGEASVVTLSPDSPQAVNEQQDVNGKISKIYNVGVGRYDVAVSVGPSFNTKRQEAAESMAQMTQANPALWGVLGDLLVKNMDLPGGQEMAKRMRATIPPEILQDEEEGEPMDPEVMAQFQQMEQMLAQVGEQMQAVSQENAEFKETIGQKLIERDMKADELEMKRMEQETRRMEIELKREEAAEKLGQNAEKQEIEYAAMSELVQTAALGSQQNSDLLAALAQSTAQNSEILGVIAKQLASPRALSLELDNEGNVIGGTSQVLN